MSTRSTNDPGGLNAQQLFELLSQFTEEERRRSQLFLQTGLTGTVFSCRSLDEVIEGSTEFFGHMGSCLLFRTEQFATNLEEG